MPDVREPRVGDVWEDDEGREATVVAAGPKRVVIAYEGRRFNWRSWNFPRFWRLVTPAGGEG